MTSSDPCLPLMFSPFITPSMILSSANRLEVEETTPHNYVPDPIRLKVREIRNGTKVAVGNAVGENTTTTSNIVQAGLMNVSDAIKKQSYPQLII